MAHNRLKIARHVIKAKRKAQDLLWQDRAWERACQGMSQGAIADELLSVFGRKVHPTTVGRWLNQAERRVMATLEDRIAGYKAKQIAMLESIYWEAKQGWERSKKQQKRYSQRTMTPLQAAPKDGDMATPAAGGVQITTQTVKETPGDPRFLQEMRGAASDIRHLLGLSADTRAEAFPLRDDDDEALARAVRRLNLALGERAGVRLALPGRKEPINLVLPGEPPDERKPS